MFDGLKKNLQDSLVNIKTGGCGSDIRGILVKFPAGARDLSLLRNVRISYEAHPAYFSRFTSGAVLGRNAVRA